MNLGADGQGQAATVEAAAGELYGLDPAEFTARRDALAARTRKEGDAATAKEVKALKRPSLSAWAVNVLSRERPDQVGRLLELARELREAQGRRSGEELRRLTRDRQRVIADLSSETKELAADKGHALTEAALRQVEETLTAALADPVAADALTRGRLVRALDYAGIGPVDLGGAVAGASAEERPAPGPGSDPAPAREAKRQAERAVQGAEKSRRRAEARVAAATAEVQRLEGELDRARGRLDELRGELEQASSRADDAVEALSRLR